MSLSVLYVDSMFARQLGSCMPVYVTAVGRSLQGVQQQVHLQQLLLAMPITNLPAVVPKYALSLQPSEHLCCDCIACIN